MNEDLQLILSTLGAVSTVVLVPFGALLVRGYKLLLQVAQTVHGVDGRNGLVGWKKDADEQLRDTTATVAEHEKAIERAQRDIDIRVDRYHDQVPPLIAGAQHANLKLAEAVEHLARHLERAR